MKRILLSLSILIMMAWTARSQSAAGNVSAGDTATYPYWVRMMQDPDQNFYKVQKAFNTYWKDRKVTRGSGWKVYKRWEYWTKDRISPDGKRPAPDAVKKAYEAYVDSHSPLSLNGNWTSLGPSYIPLPGPGGYEGLGRINTVAWHPTDPNKIFIGAPAGGLWQSTDGGATWTTHTDSLATLGVSAIIIDAANPSVIFIGTGDRDAGDAPGMGAYKSTDGGLTWAPSNSGMGNKTVGKMIQNGQTLLAATNSGVYRSTNNGTSWTLSFAGDFKDIVFKPGDPNTVYATASGSFYRSTNNGQSFVKITSGLPSSAQRASIAVTAANSSYVYLLLSGSDSGLKGVYRSTDGGVNFTTQMTSPNILDWSCDGSGSGGQGWYDLSIAADPLNANTLYVGGVDVWKSTNGGTSFTINSHWYGGCNVPAVHADCHFLGFSPVDGKLYAGNDGGVYSTSNGGTIWNDLTVGITIGQIYKLDQSALVKNHVIIGLQDNGTYSLQPDSWYATGGGDGMECVIDYELDNYTYHTVYYGDIYRKISNASEYHIAGNGVGGIDESGDWVTPFILHNTDPKVMFVGYVNVWRTSNCRTGLPVWTKISDNLGGSNSATMKALENCSANTNILYASRNDGKFFRTDNCMADAPGWTDLTSNLPTGGTVLSIETVPEDENIVYITIGQYVYKSVNKGTSWTNITGTLPTVNKNTLVAYHNDNGGLYVGTDAGVYYRNSSMSDWINFSAGLPVNAKITELNIYYDNDSTSEDAIRAATYGRALWSSDLYHGMPDVDFAASSTTLSGSCTISFTDLSTNVPTNWLWTFTGGTPSTSTDKNPANIAYLTPGVYPVKLKAWNEAGADSLIKTDYIHVTDAVAPVAQFSSDKQAVCYASKVYFHDESTNCPSQWLWEFAPADVTFTDGTNMNSQNPVVIMNTPGPYTIRMTATNSQGSNTVLKNDYIYNGGYYMPFTEDFENGFGKNYWTIENADGSTTWDTITVIGTAPGSKAAYLDFFDYGNLNKRDQLISPPFSLTTSTTALLNFQHAYAQRATLKDSLIVKVSTDCGATWTRVLNLGPGSTPDIISTHENSLEKFFPQSSDDWCGGSYGLSCYTVDLSAYAGWNNIKLMFETYNRHGNNLYLDNIMLAPNVGMPEKADMNAVSIYPNPTKGSFSIRMNNISGKMNISVIDPGGKHVYSEKFISRKNEEHKMDLSRLSKGVYFLHFTSDSYNGVEKIILY